MIGLVTSVPDYLRLQLGQWHSPEQLEARQWERFKRILQHAFDNSDFYGRKFREAGVSPADINERADLQRLPITTREELRGAKSLVARAFDTKKLNCSRTSGSTGKVTTTYFDDRAWMLSKYLMKARARFACGVRLGDRIALLQEDDSSSGPIRTRLLRQKSFSILKQIQEVLPELRRFAPTALYGFPSYLARLSEVAGESISPRRIFTSGEMLDGETRRTIERAFRAPVYDIYGCTELKEIAWQCPERAGYHINSDWVLVESLAEGDGGEHPAGTLLVTSLYNSAMPLIRYQLGDTGELIDSPCPCGRGLPLMAPCLGRSVDYFVLPNGALVSPYAMTCAVELVEGMCQYQIVQQARDRVVVNVVPLQSFDPTTEEQIRSALEPILRGVEVRVRRVDEIGRESSGKYRIVVSHVGANTAGQSA